MADLSVKPVASRRERKLFLEFPWTLYRGDPNWIPPLRMDQKELVGYARIRSTTETRCRRFWPSAARRSAGGSPRS